MNKKIFAALASATMALSATGSLAVFAEDFDVVTEADGNNGAGAGLVVPNSAVKLNSENFPDQGFLNDLLKFFGNAAYGTELTSEQVKAVDTIYVDGYTKDLKGIEVFGNLKNVETGYYAATWNTTTKKWDAAAYTPATDAPTAGANLVTANLSENSELAKVNLTNVNKLQTLTVPEGKKLNSVTVRAASAPITEIDLSGNKWLNDVTINGTDVAKIDLSNNVYMTTANLASNDLNTVDLTNCTSLADVNVSSNELYGIELPDSPDMKVLNVSNNLLQELDVTNLTNLATLIANDNEIRSIDLINNTALGDTVDGIKGTLRLENNHIGALNIPNSILTDLYFNELTGSWVNPQTVYVGDEFNAINLVDSFEEFEKDQMATTTGYNKKTGVFELTGGKTTYTYYCNDESQYYYTQVDVIKADVLNRLYNPNSGEHFYTADLDEKDALVKLGWHDEGIGWVSPTESATPVYRLYNPNAGDHHYTTNAFERDTLTSVGWKYEGIGWYSATPIQMDYNGVNGIKTVKVLREYNPNAKAAGAHNYTINHAENDFLVSVGWLDEGIAWWSLK